MDASGGAAESLAPHLELLCCPKCAGDFELAEDELRCRACGQAFAVSENIPRLFWPHEGSDSPEDVTEKMKAFYEETPFPNYEEFDSVGSLIRKAREGLFAKLLDDEVPPGSRVVECGCGTGQLSNFLSISNRTVFGTDLCLNSLKLGQKFKEQNDLGRVNFLQMNLFRPAFKKESVDLVISNGVLHHTADPFGAFRSIGEMVRPNGYIMVGLYHRYGRLITDFRRQVFHLSGNRFTFLDPNLRRGGMTGEKWKAWFMDQYKNPHESKHTIGEVMAWLRKTGFEFVKSVPRGKPFQPFSPGKERLFEAESPGNWLERLIVELGMIRTGSREGGFFVVIAKKPARP